MLLISLTVCCWLDSDPFTREFTPTLKEWNALQERVEYLENHTIHYQWLRDGESTLELPEWRDNDYYRGDTLEMPLYQNNDCGKFHY